MIFIPKSKSQSRLSRYKRKQSGLTLVEIIVILVLIAIMLAISEGLKSWWNKKPPPWYTIITPVKQEPTSIVITNGPQTINPGVAATYTVTVTYPAPINATNGFGVIVSIWEDDLGDVLLDRRVRISVPAGATSGSATFTLTCLDPNGDGSYTINGDNGSNTLDDTWEIFAYVPDQTTSESKEGPNYNVSCEEP
ncbi:MAG: prepilin-type N-terminal cleavage/methylation domain-containing protein [Woeseiaceae bacterium]|nr:prepilin-type N-terminal cleavage/methylation domain-containing protein [Woeseiaceae bacterium]